MVTVRDSLVKKGIQKMLRKYPEVWKLLSRCRLVLRPGSAAAHLALGHALARQGRYPRAADSFRRAVSLRPDSVEAHLALGHAQSQLGQDEEAAFSFQQSAALDPDCTEAHQSLARIRFRQGQNELAVASARRAIALRPDCVESHVCLGHALDRLGRHQDAIAVFQQALALQPDAAAHYRVGMALFLQKKEAESIEYFSQAVTLDPELVEARLTHANVLFRLDRLPEAIASYRRLCELTPHSVDAHLKLGTALFVNGEVEAAKQIWERALALDPTALDSYYEVWSSLAATGHLEAAVKYYRRHREMQRTLAREHGLEDNGIRYLTDMWSRQVGHLAHLDCYVKLGILGLRPDHRTVLVATPDRISNPCYLDYWRRFIGVISEPAQVQEMLPRVKCVEDFLSMNSLEEERTCLWAPITAAVVQWRWEAEGRGPLLALSEADAERGRRCLRTLGVPEGAWFVALHVRDDGFHERENSQNFRNADIDTYRAAIASIAARGGWVIRMGDRTMKPAAAMENLIDYAHSPAKSDRMDVFLCARCRFFIGSQSGLSLVPPTFGVPCAMTNWTSLGTPPWYGQDLFLPKVFWSEKEARFLTFEEIIRSGLGYTQWSACFSCGGIRLVDNTAEDIHDLVLEMLARLDGTLSYTAADESLQNRYKQRAEAHGVVVLSRMGRNFLRKHAALLGLG
jgi:putative glycosyltransferase (TIGR04372 family)